VAGSLQVMAAILRTPVILEHRPETLHNGLMLLADLVAASNAVSATWAGPECRRDLSGYEPSGSS